MFGQVKPLSRMEPYQHEQFLVDGWTSGLGYFCLDCIYGNMVFVVGSGLAIGEHPNNTDNDVDGHSVVDWLRLYFAGFHF